MFRIPILYVLFLSLATAQEMNMGGMNAAGTFLMGQASGTGMNPQSWPMPMIMLNPDDWSLMFMAQAFLVDTQESGPRGADKFYSANWGMFAASHHLGGGSFMFQTDAQPGSSHHHESALSQSCSKPAKPHLASRW